MHLRLTYAFLLAFTFSAFAQLRINELMASNTRAYPDITDFEDYPDWIELFNDSPNEISLANHCLSDDPGQPLKWSFDAGATIPAGGYLIVIADGNDTPLGTTLRRTSFGSPSYTTEKHHTNFRLSSAGETLTLSSVELITTPLIENGATWNYLDDGSDQSFPFIWAAPGFDDSSWSTGDAPFGYNEIVNTTLSFGPDNNRHITSYFRHDFTATNISSFETLNLSFRADDGAVVYLNGLEIARFNISNVLQNHLTTADIPLTPDLEGIERRFVVDPSLLREGNNVLAVEVHQIGRTSVDMFLELSLEARRTGASTEVDTITYTQQVSDISYGRSETDPSTWVQFAESTPGAQNGGPLVTNLREQSGDVEISPQGGVITGPITVTLSCDEGTIFYTLDGSNPSTESIEYDAPFEVSTNTVVRARCFATGQVPGQIATKTYLRYKKIGEEIFPIVPILPILSVVADPETLFGNRIGIYFNQHEARVGIGPSVYKGKDAPGHLEFFPPDGSEGFGVNGGFRIGGENNWASHAQRALNFATRGRYGDDSIDYDLFPGSGIPSFTALTLREGGDDWGQAHLTDAIFDSIVRGRMEVETNRYRPSALFINGVYWGLYNIRDRWDENWFFQHYGTNDGEYDRIDLGNGSVAENGDTDDWRRLLSLLDENDIQDPEIWTQVQREVDLDSAADFVLAESYGRNSSWGGNREIWKDSQPGGKWRYFIPDMDRTFGNTRDLPILGALWGGDALISRLNDHPEFRRLFAQRSAAQMHTTFEEDRIVNLITELGEVAEVERARQQSRWGTPTNGVYNGALARMRDFARDRSDGMLGEIQDFLGLGTAINLSLATTQGGGSFEIEGVPVRPSTLEIFPNLDIEIEAVPAPGFRFDGWVGRPEGATLRTSFAQASVLRARFVPGSGSEVGGALAANTTFTAAGSPYVITSDLIVPAGVTLTMEAGARVEIARQQNIRVQGTLLVTGSESAPVEIVGLRSDTWGGLSFETPTTESILSHLVVRHASRGADPLTYPAAISGLGAQLVIEFLDISDGLAPLFFRGGNLILRDSLIDIPITGDGLNVKQGEAQTIRCTFTGNDSPDTDAIDYDGVVDGLIQDCRIYRFFGFNSDGIDTGEQCVNVLVEGNRIYFNSDKGISVGQGSSVIAKNNLIVGCDQGIGIKDEGSTVLSDQNTFVNCNSGIAVFEKNFGSGGGFATVTNTIFSGSKFPVSSDTFSNVEISYSLSDTVALPGNENLVIEPAFTDADRLDFSLQVNSPARDSGDPNHDLDPDGTRADRGALYQYDPEDYPFLLNNTIVINEVLANSGPEVDWLELHNRSDEDTDISGWYLSDDGSDLLKYRIADGTIIPARGYLVFYEDMHFGSASTDPGKRVSFSLSDTGETVHLSSAVAETLTDYRFRENFGASLEGHTLGFYFKESTDSYNFVAQHTPTPAAPNGSPALGPLVISEIMYEPTDSSASEYLEILNISNQAVALSDGSSWRIGNGIDYTFSAGAPILQPGDRVLLVQNLNALASYNLPPDLPIFQWTSGRLSNGGEIVQLERPGPLENDGSRSYVRIDRVNYDNDAPWPVAAAGEGSSLTRKSNYAYGNDFINWEAQSPSPGTVDPNGGFAEWAFNQGYLQPYLDSDGDGIANLLEYAFDLDPTEVNANALFSLSLTQNEIELALTMAPGKDDIELSMQHSPDLKAWFPLSMEADGMIGGQQLLRTLVPVNEGTNFFRLQGELKP